MSMSTVSSMTNFPFSERSAHLGTETAYKVAVEAANMTAKGKVVYPFHIGDLDMPTPTHVKEACIEAINKNYTGYCAAGGIPRLREVIGQQIGKERGLTYTPDEVSIQPGGKPTLFKFFLALLNRGDEVLYPSPGYPIYESVINYLGGGLKPYTYHLNAQGEYEIDMEHLKSQITEKTRLLVVNNPSNPTGALSTDSELEELASIAKAHNLIVLSDEPYFHLVYEPKGKYISIASLPGMKERTVIGWTLSKSYCMTGWRIGAALGPANLIAMMNKLNTNIEGCTTHFVQHAAIAIVENEKATNDHVEKLKNELKARRDALVNELKSIDGFKAIPGPSTFYLWVNATEALKLLGCADVEEFRRKIMDETGVVFCTRDHFGCRQPYETDFYVRFAYSSSSQAVIKEGMASLRNYMGNVRAAGS